MHSHWSEYSHRRQDGDRNSSQWDENNDRRDGRLRTHSKIPRDSYHNYRGDGHNSTERGDRSREYHETLNRRISEDSSNRDWSRKSPVRRRVSSPVWDVSEKRSRRYTEEEDGDLPYRHKSLNKSYRLSPDSFSHNHNSKDLKFAPPREEDFRYRRTPPDFRSRNQCDEFTQRKQHEDLSVRNLSGCFIDQNDRKRRQDFSPEGTRSPDRFTKMYTNRGRMNSPPSSVYHQDYQQYRTRAPNESSTKAFGSNSMPQSPSVPETKLSKGFQLFLDVLNKGVNVDSLTKIVSQTSTEVGDENVSQSSFVNSADLSWSPGSTEKQQKLPVFNEKVLQKTDGRENLFKSPSVEKIALTPEDEEKRKQMQDVLQVIGVDLGFEELGQMSHRIQERLYGKKDDDNEQKLSRERSTNQAFTSRHQSRSSSSGSSFSPTTQDSSIKKDSCSVLKNPTEVDQVQVQSSTEYSQGMSSSSFQSSEDSKTSQEKTPAWSILSPTSTDTVTQPPPASLIPTYFPTSCPPLPYSAFPSVPPPGFPRAAFLPHMPPMLPYLSVPPNVFPPVLAQIRHLLPPSPQLFAPPNVNSLQVLNKTQASHPQKSKTPPRTRCLRVIK